MLTSYSNTKKQFLKIIILLSFVCVPFSGHSKSNVKWLNLYPISNPVEVPTVIKVDSHKMTGWSSIPLQRNLTIRTEVSAKCKVARKLSKIVLNKVAIKGFKPDKYRTFPRQEVTVNRVSSFKGITHGVAVRACNLERKRRLNQGKSNLEVMSKGFKIFVPGVYKLTLGVSCIGKVRLRGFSKTTFKKIGAWLDCRPNKKAVVQRKKLASRVRQSSNTRTRARKPNVNLSHRIKMNSMKAYVRIKSGNCPRQGEYIISMKFKNKYYAGTFLQSGKIVDQSRKSTNMIRIGVPVIFRGSPYVYKVKFPIVWKSKDRRRVGSISSRRVSKSKSATIKLMMKSKYGQKKSVTVRWNAKCYRRL